MLVVSFIAILFLSYLQVEASRRVSFSDLKLNVKLPASTVKDYIVTANSTKSNFKVPKSVSLQNVARVQSLERGLGGREKWGGGRVI